MAKTLFPARKNDILELDEIWSFVGKKENKYWLWLALCRRRRQIVGFAFGDRSFLTCNLLYESIPKNYRKCLTFSDFWDAYGVIFPHNISVGKDSGETAHIEKFNLTLRQRIGRLVRKKLSFSKCHKQHQLVISAFIKNYNLNILKTTQY